MTHSTCLRPLLVAALLCGLSHDQAHAGVAHARLQEPEQVKRGREIFQVACVQCHGTSEITIQRKPAKGWQKTVYSMIGRGAPVLSGEIDPLVAFLTATYGPASPPPVLKRLDAFSVQRKGRGEPK